MTVEPGVPGRRSSRPLGRRWPVIIERAAMLAVAETERVGVAPTLRRIHYLLLGDGPALAAGYTNTLGAYDYLSEKTAPLRDSATFPALSDRTRTVSWLTPTEPDAVTILRDAADGHRVDRWIGQPVGVVLAVEKDGLVPLMEQAFFDLGVPITALRGHVSQTHLARLRRIVDELADAHDEVVVLYGGDYDPSGLDIERDLRQRLRRAYIAVRRVALDRQQVTDHALPTAPAKETDTRTAAMAWAEGEAVQVELDALDPLVLTQLFTEAIDALAEPGRWWAQIEVEADEADELRAAADRLDVAT